MSVIVGYVPTAEGRAALDEGTRLARARGDRLVVLDASGARKHVAEGEGTWPPLEQLDADLAAAGVEYEVAGRAPVGINPEEILLEAVNDPRSDVLVVGIRRRSPVGKLLLGSSAQRLLLAAECPVLVVKADAQ